MDRRTLVVSLAVVGVVLLLWFFSAASRASASASGGASGDHQPPQSSGGSTWMSFNGENLLLPVTICGTTVSNVAVDTGSARLVVFNVPPCVPVSAPAQSLPYGSMSLSAVQSSSAVSLTIGTIPLSLPQVFFATKCDSGDCPSGLLGLMAREAGGTFPDHDFSLSFDGTSGGWLALDPNPPTDALRIPFDTSYRGFYTVHNVIVVDSSGTPKTMHAVIDSGTTMCEFPPSAGVNTHGPVKVYAPGTSPAGGGSPLVSLEAADMDLSDSVAAAFPPQTFVLGLPFFRGHHVAFLGTGVVTVYQA